MRVHQVTIDLSSSSNKSLKNELVPNSDNDFNFELIDHQNRKLTTSSRSESSSLDIEYYDDHDQLQNISIMD